MTCSRSRLAAARTGCRDFGVSTGDDLARLTMPAYIAIAARASLAGAEVEASWARRIPHAEVDVWPNTTHSLPVQVTAALGERLSAFGITIEDNCCTLGGPTAARSRT
jgi:pimeloyl-ACP methyl ester carboxylesterase